ncbi:Type I phosphodiesterase / nucleotide pyrophosphatase [Maioricimonas rarisocia]|uniref:Type I phosphodiesterase / nucleotide pyrophosphatase n=2 Tax=Maioricimonas rarisocia TaxID=2528026 RepID=A0A517Z587_9PLAN|nr:Type I phosphodiesterase / nucleotide pyrophosphatase [Maioricimonas rarisocia]
MRRSAVSDRRGAGLLWLSLALILQLFLNGPLAAQAPGRVAVSNLPARNERQIHVDSQQLWTDTGIELRAGQPVTIRAEGRVVAGSRRRLETHVVNEVGPEGTYQFSDRAVESIFPLAASAKGPAPCYCLIGRIGNSEPFFIGRKNSFVAPRSGRLQLGINDFDVTDNEGHFTATVAFEASLEPLAWERVVDRLGKWTGRPVDAASVVVFYVDGLRPDVVQEMVRLGHLPNIREQFIDGGTWLSNTFTAFPSDTITSNGTMWTGCFSDRHGLKGQVRFSRRRLVSESYLEPLGPSRSARLLSPRGIDRLMVDSQAAAISTLQGPPAGDQWLDTYVASTPPLYELLQRHGHDWSIGVLPVMTEVPPPLWSRSLARQMPYFKSHRTWEYMDDANADYAVRNLLQRREPVTIIWLPETDSCSHKCCRGQFGLTRRTIAHADRLIGEVVAELKRQQRLESTYLMLVSDHGHLGGRDRHLANFDIANDLIFRPRQLDEEGNWIGGGLGLSVRMHRFANRHSDDRSREFVFIDGDTDGAARLFLPKGHYRSGDWSGPNRPGDLLRYRLDPQRPPVNLIDALTHYRTAHPEGGYSYPIDLVLMKLSSNSILISTLDRGHAFIERVRGPNREWFYSYQIVENIRPGEDGSVQFTPVKDPQRDPLGLLQVLSPELMAGPLDEATWLRVSANTPYPDAVVTLTRHMLWDRDLKFREAEFAPDLVVTARADWYFGMKDSPGTMHGYPLAPAMRASWFVTGPNVRKGTRSTVPCRLVDLTPTILHMIGLWPPHHPTGRGPHADSEEGESESEELPRFDGRPVLSLYESDEPGELRPVYWHDLDLQGWRPLEYRSRSVSPYRPVLVNNPDHPFDLNNMMYDLMLLADLSLIRVLDDVVSPLAGQRRLIVNTVGQAEQFFRTQPKRWVADTPNVLDVQNVTLSDYSITSQGNLQRIDRAVDWVQVRGQEFESEVAQRVPLPFLPGGRLVNRTIDGVQQTFWDAYRFGQRVVIEIVDEGIVNGVEDGTSYLLNRWGRVPSEQIVTPTDE